MRRRRRRRDLVARAIAGRRRRACATRDAPRTRTWRTSAGRSRRRRWTRRSGSDCGPGRSSGRRGRRPGSVISPGLQLVSRRDDAPEATETSKRAARRGSASAGATDDAERARELEAEIRRLRRDRDAAERKSAAAEDARARMAEQVASMQSRLDAARAKLAGCGVLRVRATDEREARSQGVRRGGTQAEGERRLAAGPRHRSPTRTRPGCSTSAYMPNGKPLSSVIRGRYDAIVFSVSKSFSPVSGLCVVTTQRGTCP